MDAQIRRAAIGATIFAVALALACRDTTAPTAKPLQRRISKTLLNPAGRVVVYPGGMHSWVFYDDQADTLCTKATVCRMVLGAGTPPLGTGSAELDDSLTTDGKALLLPDYGGTRFDQFTQLTYSTYRQSADSGNNLAISLQFNADYDLTDTFAGYQGRLVFEPYQGIGGNVPQGTWQTWDATAGKWWGTRSTVTQNNVVVTNPCVQATPCSWSQLLTTFPNVGVHAVYGAVVLKAGSGWHTFRGNVDQLSIGVSGVTTTFDFELTGPPATVPASAPEGLAAAYLADTISHNSQFAGAILRQVAMILFQPNTSQPARQSAIDAVGGVVVGGRQFSGGDGLYYVQVPTAASDSTGGPLFSAIAKLKALPQVRSATPEVVLTNFLTYRLPNNGSGETSRDWQLNPDSAFGNTARLTWALEAINAPYAWGCSFGGSTRVGVIDVGLSKAGNIARNVDTTSALYVPASLSTHGTLVASILAAAGNDTVGITGVMWQAKLYLSEVAFRDTITHNIVIGPDGEPFGTLGLWEQAASDMIARGVRVISISLGSPPPNPLPLAHTAAQDALRAAWGAKMVEAIDIAFAIHPSTAVRPIWVISAGNWGNATDVYWSASTGIADALGTETIVVTAASAQKGQLWSGATGLGNIDIAAPGDHVAGADTVGVKQLSGSSAAVPLVSGTAGLLFAFDPTISDSLAKTLIMQSANRGTREVVGRIPFVDAYAALKLSAARHGAPLCGNRVWLDNASNVVAQRDTSAANDETLIPNAQSGGDYYTNFINVYHGGHRIDLDQNFDAEYDYDLISRTFSGPKTATQLPEIESGAMFASSNLQTDHQDSITTIAFVTGSGANAQVNLNVFNAKTGSLISSMPTPSQSLLGMPTPDSTCVRQDPQFGADSAFLGYNTCTTYAIDGTFKQFVFDHFHNDVINLQLAIAPQANFVIIPINIMSRSITHSSVFETCFGTDTNHVYPAHCYALTEDAMTSAYFKLLRANLQTSAWDSVATDDAGDFHNSNQYAEWISVAESGQEAALQVVNYEYDFYYGTYNCSTGYTTFMALPGSPTRAGTSLKQYEYLDGSRVCAGVFDAGATLSALRAKPGAPGILIQRRPPPGARRRPWPIKP